MKVKNFDSHIHSIRGMVSEGEGRPQWEEFTEEMEEVIQVLQIHNKLIQTVDHVYPMDDLIDFLRMRSNKTNNAL